MKRLGIAKVSAARMRILDGGDKVGNAQDTSLNEPGKFCEPIKIILWTNEEVNHSKSAFLNVFALRS